jgi:hypothetical protein
MLCMQQMQQQLVQVRLVQSQRLVMASLVLAAVPAVRFTLCAHRQQHWHRSPPW